MRVSVSTDMPTVGQWLTSVLALMAGTAFFFLVPDRIGTLLAGVVLGMGFLMIVLNAVNLHNALHPEDDPSDD